MYSGADLNVEQMWSKVLNKLSLISDKVPSISLKKSKNGEVLYNDNPGTVLTKLGKESVQTLCRCVKGV